MLKSMENLSKKYKKNLENSGKYGLIIMDNPSFHKQ